MDRLGYARSPVILMRNALLGLVLVSTTHFAPLALADASPPVGSAQFCMEHPHHPACKGIQGSGSGGTFGVGGSTPPLGSGSGPKASPSGIGAGGKPVVAPSTYRETAFAPTCTGNTALDAGVLCGAAVNTCLPLGVGIIRYWEWTVTYRTVDASVVSIVALLGSFCVAPEVAGPPAAVVIAGIVERDFKTLVVARGTAEVQPRGTTLVNYPTKFFTSAREYVLPAVTILGRRVVITARPQSYDWFFGDGQSALDVGPGQARDSEVRHVYGATGLVAPYVVITWSGTFTVDGGPVQQVFGTARTTGPGTALQVKQARAELVTK